MIRTSLGTHHLVEFFGCCVQSINSREVIREAMLAAAEVAKATVVADVFHEFNPYGMSGVVVIAESHIAVHSWPEHGCASVDIFTCSEDMDPLAAIDFLRERFKAEGVQVKMLSRGVSQHVEEYAPIECSL